MVVLYVVYSVILAFTKITAQRLLFISQWTEHTTIVNTLDIFRKV